MQNSFKSDIELLRYLKTKPRHGATTGLDDLKKALNSLTPIVDGLKQSFSEIAALQAYDELAKFVRNFTDDINILNNRYNDLTKAFKLSEKQAVNYGYAIEKLGVELKIAPDLAKKFSAELAKSIPGTLGMIKKTNEYSVALLEQQEYLRDQIGLSAEHSEAIQKVTAAGKHAGVGFKTYRDELVAAGKQIEKETGRTGVAARAFENLADAGAAVSIRFGQFPKKIAEAQRYADKLGASFKEIAGVGKKFLDIESSISNELELQLLGGKKINSEKFREAQMTGDMQKQAEELAKIIEEQGEDAMRDPFLLESLAKNLNLSEDRILEMYATLKQGEDLIEGAADKTQIGTDPTSGKPKYEFKDPLLGEDLDIRTNEEKELRKLEIEQSKAFQDAVTRANGVMARYEQSIQATTKVYDAAKAAGGLMEAGFKKGETLITNAMVFAKSATAAGDIWKKIKTADFNADNLEVKATGDVTVTGTTGTGTKTGDLYVASDQKTVVTGPFGAFELDQRDSVIAGDFDAPTTKKSNTASSSPSNVNVMVKLALGTQTMDQITSYVLSENDRRMNA